MMMCTTRAAIARFYKETRSIDIISNKKFIRANAIFTGIQKINKKIRRKDWELSTQTPPLMNMMLCN